MAVIHRLETTRIVFPIFALLLVAVAWTVFHKDLSTEPRELPAITTAAVVTPQGSYLVFKEIGVKMTLSNGITDAVFAPFNVPSTDNSKVFGISSQSLINKDSSAKCAAASGPLGLIIATTSPTVITGPNSTTQLTPDNKTVFKIGSTYYRYVPPQEYGCMGKDVTLAQLQSAQDALSRSFASLQADGASTPK